MKLSYIVISLYKSDSNFCDTESIDNSMNNSKKTQSQISQVKSKIKVVFLGDQSTGKTSILMRFMHDKFQEGLGATVGIDFMAKNLIVNNRNLRLQLWDTAGQQRFRSLIPSYLKDATVTFVVFDLTNKKSFQSVKQWFQLCNQNRKQKSIMVLIGNKSDLRQQRKVQYEQANLLAKNENIMYLQVSAKTNTNINQMFNKAAQQYVNTNFHNESKDVFDNDKELSRSVVFKDHVQLKNQKPVTRTGSNIKKKSGCC